MTNLEVQKEIENIRRVTEEAIKSKESARQFLVDAGILKGEPVSGKAVDALNRTFKKLHSSVPTKL